MKELELITLFYHVDNFCKMFEPIWEKKLLEGPTSSSRWWKTRKSSMALSEIMTIIIFFQIFKSWTFKDYYLDHVTTWRHFFPKLVSYSRFISLVKQVTVPLYVFQKILQGSSKGIAFIDSTPLSVCHICRSSSHKLFKDVAAKGKTSTGWFVGLKLHVIVNHKGEIITWSLTQGNVSDLSQVQPLCKNLKGKLVGDRGYISSKLFNLLIEEGLQLLTRIRSNMKNILMDTFNKCLLKKRALIESVFALFKTKYHIDHHRHRSKVNFFINLLGGLIAYSVSKKKPTLRNVWVN